MREYVLCMRIYVLNVYLKYENEMYTKKKKKREKKIEENKTTMKTGKNYNYNLLHKRLADQTAIPAIAHTCTVFCLSLILTPPPTPTGRKG